METQNHKPVVVLGLLIGLATLAIVAKSSVAISAPIPANTDVSESFSADEGSIENSVTIDFPEAVNTFPFQINAEGDVVGRYLSAGKTHGFLRTAAGEWSTIDYPGSNFTVAAAINDQGDITGWYTLPSSSVRHGFLLMDGVFSSFDPPGSIFTNAVGINERGDIVGRYCTVAPCAPGSGNVLVFLLREGEFSTIAVPDAAEATAFKINDRGQIVGGFQTADLKDQIFLFTRGEFSVLSPPDGRPVSLDNGGINERGDIVGMYCETATPCGIGLTGTHGFLMNAGKFTSIDIPDAVATGVAGINARGDLVGSYSDGAHFHGFLLSR